MLALRAEHNLFLRWAGNKKMQEEPNVLCVCVCASRETQLDSLLYPRDERSATWAFPCCDLAPFGDSESCTHVHISHNNTAEALETAWAIHTLLSQPSTERTFVSLWQMVFRILANLPLQAQVQVSQPQARSPSMKAAFFTRKRLSPCLQTSPTW